MPVTFTVAGHPAQSIPSTPVTLTPQAFTADIRRYIDKKPSQWPSDGTRLFSTSLIGSLEQVNPSKNGFTDACIRAYNQHHHLIIRPDDVWAAIIGPFSLYVNTHAEELRGSFVPTQERKKLKISVKGDAWTRDYAWITNAFVDLMKDNLQDKELSKWMLPKFTTTTRMDALYTSVMMMGTLQAHSTYDAVPLRGIPTVTLKGEKTDYMKIMRRLDKLASFGKETGAWGEMLRPIILRFISAFDGEPDEPFWNQICRQTTGQGGNEHYTGWITAFCPFDGRGKWQLLTLDVPEHIGHLRIDGVVYQALHVDGFSWGFAYVDIKVIERRVPIKATVVAGLMGVKISDGPKSNSRSSSNLFQHEANTSISPHAAWFIYEKTPYAPCPESSGQPQDLHQLPHTLESNRSFITSGVPPLHSVEPINTSPPLEATTLIQNLEARLEPSVTASSARREQQRDALRGLRKNRHSLQHNIPRPATLRSITNNQASANTTTGTPGLSPQTTAALNRSENTECIVCTGIVGEVQFPTGPPTSACNHPSQVCMDCLQQTILTSIKTGAYITGIRCPSLDCAQKLEYHDIQKWSSRETFERYDKLLLQDSLRTDVHYVICLEPSCAAGQEHTGGEHNNIVTCHVCGTKQCFRHQVLWHEGFTCVQWDEHQNIVVAQQEMSDEWILGNTKPCPLCKRPLEKNEGCDHFTCRPPGGCGHQFCWECLAPWGPIISGDNSRHYDHCRHYNGPVGENPAVPEIRTVGGPLAIPAIRVIGGPPAQQQQGPNLFHRALHLFRPRPANVQQHPREFNPARMPLTLPPVANWEALNGLVAPRRNRAARVIDIRTDNPGQGQNWMPGQNGSGIDPLDVVLGHINLNRAGPREASGVYTRLEIPRVVSRPFREREREWDIRGGQNATAPRYERRVSLNRHPHLGSPATVGAWLENTRGSLPSGAARPRAPPANQPSSTSFAFTQQNLGPPETSGRAGSSTARRNALL